MAGGFGFEERADQLRQSRAFQFAFEVLSAVGFKESGFNFHPGGDLRVLLLELDSFLFGDLRFGLDFEIGRRHRRKFDQGLKLIEAFIAAVKSCVGPIGIGSDL